MNPKAMYNIVNEQHSNKICVDSSLQGLGAVWEQGAYSERIPDVIRRGQGFVHFEIHNVWLAINSWGHKLQNSTIRIHAVIQLLNTYKTKDECLGTCMRNIMLLHCTC